MDAKNETTYTLISAVEVNGAPKEQDASAPGRRPFVVVASAAIAFAILIVNIIILIWSATKFGIRDGTATVYTGAFSEVKRISTWSHLGINILSTILLAASNGCMQRLNSPTRADIDTAHSKGHYLDIGVLGTRNFKFISTGRVWLWLTLAVSTVPLHLLYNSVVYESMSPNDYLYNVVSTDFFDNAPPWNTTFWDHWVNIEEDDAANLSHLVDLQQHPSELIKLENADCIKAYAQDYVVNFRTLFMVTNVTSPTDSMFAITRSETLGGLSGVSSGWSWVCTSEGQDSVICDINGAVSGANEWLQEAVLTSPNGSTTLVTNARVEYCMAEPAPESSTLGISASILIVVIVCNIIKLACFLLMPRVMRGEPILTVGDAVASFLEHPDPTTTGYSTLSEHDVKAGRWKPVTLQNSCPEPVPWQGKRHFWFRAASVKRWIVCTILVMAILLAGLLVLLLGMHSIAQLGNGTSSSFKVSMSTLKEIGFGSVGEHNLLGGLYPFQSSLAGAAIIANLPQLAASGLYLMYNGLFTCMLAAKEWANFATSPRCLRVSNPVRGSSQRRTMYLQLPYTYAVPIMIGSTVLHWLLSQSIFVARLQIRGLEDFGLDDPNRLFTGIGWSPLPLIVVLVVGGVMMLGLFTMGFRRFNGNIPLAGHCSVAISAACRRKQEETDVTMREIMWGVIGAEEDGTRYAGFSGDLVQPLVAGESYR